VVEDGGLMVDAPPIPKAIFVVSAPVQYESDILLTAVGIDTDGKIRPIDELSYKPEAGWQFCHPTSMFDVQREHGLKAVRLALTSVYRWYQFKSDTESARLAFDYIEQITPVRAELLEKDEETGQYKDSFVWGVFRRRQLPSGNAADGPAGWNGGAATLDDIDLDEDTGFPDENFRIQVPFSINNRLGVVVFSGQVTKVGQEEDDQPDTFRDYPADLVLRGCHPFRHKEVYVPQRYLHEKQVDPQQTFDRYEFRNDLRPFRQTWAGASEDEWKDNTEEIIRESEQYATELLREYNLPRAENATYVGIYPIPLSGAILNITWSFDQGGATTQVSWNADPGGPLIESEVLRKRTETLKAITQEQLKQILSPPEPEYNSLGVNIAR
jgi:hypothetical protein